MDNGIAKKPRRAIDEFFSEENNSLLESSDLPQQVEILETPTPERSISFEGHDSLNESSDRFMQVEYSKNSTPGRVTLIETSSDMKWICYVSQREHGIGKYTTTLSIQRFKAINDQTGRSECFTQASNMEYLEESRILIEPSLDVGIISIDFTAPQNSHTFLSISPNSQYITLSTYSEEMGDSGGTCITFVVHEQEISVHSQIDCNGRAVFLNRDEPCLAVINTLSLRIYQNIGVLSEGIRYESYALTPFGTSKADFCCSSIQYNDNSNLCNWAVHGNSCSPEVQHIIALSTSLKENILITPFTAQSDTIRFWSLNNNGLRLASIVARKESVIAISRDLKYIASKRKTTTSDIINIFNFENGCLVYTLRSHDRYLKLTHATFCYNSCYLALSGVKLANAEIGLQDDNRMASFEVWNIDQEKLIYEKYAEICPRLLSVSIPIDTQTQYIRPFVFEEKTNGNRAILKGVYSCFDEKDASYSTRCFKLDINAHYITNLHWLTNGIDLLRDHVDRVDHLFGNAEYVSNRGIGNHDLNRRLDERLDEYNQRHFNKDQFSDYYYKFGIITSRPSGTEFVIRCGLYTIELWLFAGDSMQLIFIKPFINCDFRSCYLHPNLWIIDSFKSVKVFIGAEHIKVQLNIVEDNKHSPHREAQSTHHAEEFILPIVGKKNSFDYRKFEGACQALYVLNIFRINERRTRSSNSKAVISLKERRLETLTNNTLAIITSEIEELNGDCNSFKTAGASRTLAMLASFRLGRDVLKLLLKNEVVSINISGYKATKLYGLLTMNNPEEVRYNFENSINLASVWYPITKSFVMHESLLTVLIREREYYLFQLTFNRILSDSKNAGAESLYIIQEALVLLQEFEKIVLYQQCCQNLSYLRAGKGVALLSEIPRKIESTVNLQGDLIANLGSLSHFSTLEQIRKVRISQNIVIKKLNNALVIVIKICLKINLVWKRFVEVISIKNKRASSQYVLCVVPLPRFNPYHLVITSQDVIANHLNPNVVSQGLRLPMYRHKSLFLESFLNKHIDPNVLKQGDDAVAILLHYKWKAFIRRRFFFVCIIYIVYYITYCTGVQFALELYGYDHTNEDRSIATNAQHMVSLVLFFISGACLLALEVIQMFNNRASIHYFRSWYNYVDIIAIVFPVVNFVQLVMNLDYFYQVGSVCTLILWLHGIIRLRVFPSVGIALETVIQLFRKVNSVLCLLLAVVFGFTHSFIVLLRQQEDQYFQENYSGETSSTNESSMTANITLYDTSSSNGFKDPFKAFYQVWLLIFGVWDSVRTGDAGDDKMLFVLSMLFAFVTVLIFTNMIIALMSSTVEEVKQRGKKAWMTHFIDVIAETESQTSTKTRVDRKNNPAFVFYGANPEEIERHEEKLQHETQELRKILNMNEDFDFNAHDKLKKNEIFIKDFEEKLEKHLEASNQGKLKENKAALSDQEEEKNCKTIIQTKLQQNEVAMKNLEEKLDQLFQIMTRNEQRSKSEQQSEVEQQSED